MRRFDSEPKIVEYKDVKKLFLNKARELGVTVSKSDKKNLMPKVSNMFPEINFVIHQYNKMIMYPNTLAIGKTVLDFLELKTKLELLKGPRSDDEKNVIQIARLINDEIKDLNPQMSWPSKEDDLKPSRTTDYIPHLLDVFLTGLITGKSLESESSSAERTTRLKESFAQDIAFSVTNGVEKTPKSVLCPFVVKALCNNRDCKANQQVRSWCHL